MPSKNDHPIPSLLAVSATECSEHHASGSDCRFRVAWQINPHMKPGKTDPARAARQHAKFQDALVSAGAELLPVPFVHGAFDSVFAKDTAILSSRRGRPLALLSNFATPERRREQRARTEALEAQGFHVFGASAVPLEGGDVVPVPHGPVLLGHGFRSSPAARPLLETFLERPVLPLELVDPWLYHLDTALAALSDGTLLCCAGALTPTSLRALLDHPQIPRVLFIPREEALTFALNFVQIGETIITGALAAPRTEAALVGRGLRVVKVELSEFQLAGGSAACLVAGVQPERRVGYGTTPELRVT